MKQANASAKRRAVPDVEEPRFVRLLSSLAADPRFAAVVDDFRASKLVGRKRFGSHTLNAGGKMFAMLAKGRLVVNAASQTIQLLSRDKKRLGGTPAMTMVLHTWTR